MNILDSIVLQKYREIDLARKKVSALELEESIFFSRECLSLKKALTQKGSTGIIPEIKRASPSKNAVYPDLSLTTITNGYVKAGVAAISVATDPIFFKGSGLDIVEIRESNDCPLIRRDFMIDEYQIIEAKAMGADAIQLMAEVLTPFEIERFGAIAQVLGLEVMLEVSHLSHLRKGLNRHIDMVLVNNRDINESTIDKEISLSLADHIPENYVKVSEGGISSPEDVLLLIQAGYQGFMIGDRFIGENNPEESCGEFIKTLKEKQAQKTF